MKIYTIGFTQKTAQEFFSLLSQNGIQRLVDIRLKPSGQLSGFAKKEDLPFFLEYLANGCEYVHLSELAPTQEILEEYRASKDWSSYEERFEALMEARDIPNILKKEEFEEKASCLLCSEAHPEHCHRRLVTEKMAAFWPEVEIIHL